MPAQRSRIRTMPRWLAFAAALAVVACGSAPGGGDGTQAPQTVGPSSTDLATPVVPTSSPPPTASPFGTKAVVLFRVNGGANARPVDVTYTSETGVDETVSGATPGSWSKGGFWPVGASISLSATTDDLGNNDFSCEIMANGTRYTSAAEARVDGNDIIGWQCTSGPVVVESVV